MILNEDIIKTEDLMNVSGMLMTLKDSKFKKDLGAYMIKLMEKNQKLILKRALEDGMTNDKEVREIKKTYNVTSSEVAEIFKHLYDTGVKLPADIKLEGDSKIIMVTTTEETGLYRMRDFVKLRFNIKVMTVKKVVRIVNYHTLKDVA